MILLLTRKLSDKKARHEAIDSIKAKGRHIQGQALCNQGAVASKNGGKAPNFCESCWITHWTNIGGSDQYIVPSDPERATEGCICKFSFKGKWSGDYLVFSCKGVIWPKDYLVFPYKGVIWPKDSLVLEWSGQKTPWCQGWVSTKEYFGQITPTPRSLLPNQPPPKL